MESVKRAVILLKSSSGRNGGILKLQSVKEGVSVYLKADGLKEEALLYLFLSGGREASAGRVLGGELSTVLPGFFFECIKSAAVVSPDNSFLLKSTGSEWPRVIERFRLRRTYVTPPPPSAETSRNEEKPQREKPQENFESEEPTENTESENIIYKQTAEGNVQETYSSAQAAERISAVTPHCEKTGGIEDNKCPGCPYAGKLEIVDPFPGVFPGSEWIKVSYPGPVGWWHYITGSICKNGALSAKAVGVPGEYGATPPVWLEGFSAYLRCMSEDAKGYWLMFSDTETSEVLDTGQFQHDV